MKIVYTFDDGYSTVTAVSMKSLLENNKDVKDIELYIVDCGISQINIENFRKLAEQYNRNIYIVNGKGMESKIPIKLDLLYWSFVCYVRLFFCELLPELDRVLHIDCDTLVLDNLEELYNTNLKNNYCAACFDCVPSTKYLCGMMQNDQYYSNGIILFDLDKMRKDKIQERFIQYIISVNGNLPHLDQDVLNEVLKNRILALDCRYNLMTQNVVFGEKSCDFFNKDEPYYSKIEMKRGLLNPAMIHLVGYKFVSKPWAQPCYHPYNQTWMEYYDKISNNFDCERNLVKRKIKKYGLIREAICFAWNLLGKIQVIRQLEFLLEKKRIRKICFKSIK